MLDGVICLHLACVIVSMAFRGLTGAASPHDLCYAVLSKGLAVIYFSIFCAYGLREPVFAFMYVLFLWLVYLTLLLRRFTMFALYYHCRDLYIGVATSGYEVLL